MYPVPQNLDLSPFVGWLLSQICIGPDLQFRFTGAMSPHQFPRNDDTGSIDGFGAVRIDIGNETYHVREKDGWRDVSCFHKIVGRDVTAWSIDGSHEFSLTLTDNAVIRFRSCEDGYEDFSVWVRDKLWII